MNSLPGRAALSLVFAGSPGRPAGAVPVDGASLRAVRVCHSGTSRQGSTTTKKRGYDITRNPHLNKGMAFTLEERLQLGIHGLLPPCFLSQDVQVLRVMKSYETRADPLDKYILLMTLQDRNEKLFYRLLTSDIEEFMPIVYTPTVGLACQQYGHAFRRPRGLFITIHDRGHIATMLNSWPEADIKVHTHTHTHTQLLMAGKLNSAALGIAHLLMMAMAKEGISREEAAKRIWMVDSKGLIVKGRGNLNHEKQEFAHDHPHIKTLEEVVATVKPTAIIGVAAVAGAFTEKIIKDMASFNERPIIFALSNPTSKAECTAEQCYQLTEGRGIFASGSPFDKVTMADGRTFVPGQGNNAYVFPGVALGVIACGVRHISDDIFLTTAEAIAGMVTEENLAEGRLYPPLNSIREVSFKIAVKIVNYAYKNNMASLYPEPKDKEAFVLSHIYSPDYDSFALDTYSWPQEAMNVQDV
uniref:Malic enzyme 3, NADP(+)-dependent, mitochondrial n=1 Tax=Gasterosteus aculeatus aculeatus TaxID=481459 RepID=A0AAQ4R0P9_GASAC